MEIVNHISRELFMIIQHGNINIRSINKNLSTIRNLEILEILIINIVLNSLANNKINLANFTKRLDITKLILVIY